MSDGSQERPQERPWHDATGTAKLLGLTLALTPGEGAAVSMRVTPDHANRHGNLHGGLISTVLDTAMGATASYIRGDEGKVPFSTISMNVNFLAPMPMGGTITATGRVMGGGYKTVFIEGVARSDDGTIVAQATGTFKRAPI
ncbi:PaaI family thioesterase [Pararhodobacter sp. CCB-MM2]|uniref:PaaI family thioesterase n=1 Tax=Pararhodobacter sp. CCB-MM2 TaxID=1786003 RepID=UPI00082D6926|nr:PaaI family thioesterase [Pararhodobacter sp. CCB-MM2]